MRWLASLLSQSMTHALIAAVVVEALLRAWRLEDGAWRLRLRLLPILVPVVWIPALLVVAPWRQAPWFAAGWAVFSGERWNLLHVGPMGLGALLLLLSAGLGSGLFLRDAVPPLLDQMRGSTPPPSGPWSVVSRLLDARIRHLSGRLGIAPPVVRLVRHSAPLLLCTGWTPPALVISTGTLDRLDDAALDAALAHELAHAAFGDPAFSLGLMAARAVLFFNPAVQWTGRMLVDEMERRADQTCVRIGADPHALARAIRLLFLAGDPAPINRDASFERLFWRTRLAGIEDRCRRLTGAFPPPALADRGFRLCLATAGLLVVLFFVV